MPPRKAGPCVALGVWLLLYTLMVADMTFGWQRPAIDPDLYEAARRGSVPVLVELRLPPQFGNSGAAQSTEPEEARRQAIEAIQTSVLSHLAGTTFVLRHRYASIPWLALEVHEDALRALQSMRDVARVTRDTLARPLGPVPPTSTELPSK